MNKLILERKEKEVFMEVRIQSIHFDASEKLEAFIQKKAEKLEKFCDNIKKVEKNKSSTKMDSNRKNL